MSHHPIDLTQFSKDVTPPANGQAGHMDQPVRRPMQPYHHTELTNVLTEAYLVKELLDQGAFCVLYGASGCGKTFLAIDLAWHVALGWDWFRLRVRQCPVYYLSAEGGMPSMSRRRLAFLKHHCIEAEDAPLHICPTPADLCDKNADTEPLIAEAKRINAGLIIIDTLSRVLAGGNENGPDDMGAFVGNIDRIRQETGAHVLVVHHTGKDEARGARGHSSLRAATDTEIEVSNGAVTVTKARDYGGVDGIAFKLEAVELGTDDEGDAITSCVVVPVDAPAARKSKTQPRMPKGAQIALRALRELIGEHGQLPPASNHIPASAKIIGVDMWREYAYARGISSSADADAKRKAFTRSVEALTAAGVVDTWQGDYWITQKE